MGIDITTYDERDQHSMEQVAQKLAKGAVLDLTYSPGDPHKDIDATRPADFYEIRESTPGGRELSYRFSPNDEEFAYIKKRAKKIVDEELG